MYLTDTTTDKSYVIKVPLKRSNILIFAWKEVKKNLQKQKNIEALKGSLQ